MLRCPDWAKEGHRILGKRTNAPDRAPFPWVGVMTPALSSQSDPGEGGMVGSERPALGLGTWLKSGFELTSSSPEI